MSRKLLTSLVIGPNTLQLWESTPRFRDKEYIIEFTDAVKCTVTPVLNIKSNNMVEEHEMHYSMVSTLQLYYEIINWQSQPRFLSNNIYEVSELKNMLDLISCGKLYNITWGGTGPHFYYKDFNIDRLPHQLKDLVHGVNEGTRHIVVNVNNFMKGDMTLFSENRSLPSGQEVLSTLKQFKGNISDLYNAIYKHTTLGCTPKTLWEQRF